MSKKTRTGRSVVERGVHGEAAGDGGSQDDFFDWRTFKPSMLEGGANAPLAAELITYRDRLDDLLQHESEYVVIKGQEIAGFFRNRRSAVDAAVAKYGRGPFLVKKIVEKEPIQRIGSASL